MNIAPTGNGDDWDDTELIKQYDKAVKNWRKSKNDSDGELPTPTETSGPGPWICVDEGDNMSLDEAIKRQEQSKLTVGNWITGSPCRAVWSQDGLEYEAKIIAIEGARCTIRFVGYANEEKKELKELKDTFGKRSRDRQRREAQISYKAMNPDRELDVEEYYSSVSLSSSMYNNCPDSILIDRDDDQQTTTTECSNQPRDSVSSSSQKEKTHKKSKSSKAAGKRKREDEMDSRIAIDIVEPQEPTRLDIDERAEEILPSGAEATIGSSSSSDISEDEGDEGDDEATSGGVFREALKGFPSMIPRLPIPPMPMSLAGADGKFDFGRGQLPSLLLSWYMSGYHAGYFDARQESNNGGGGSKNSRNKDDIKTRSKRQ